MTSQKRDRPCRLIWMMPGKKQNLELQLPGRETGSAVSSDAKPETPASIEVLVSLSEGLEESVAGSDTLFVYARALQGPPMPLALVRMNAARAAGEGYFG